VSPAARKPKKSVPKVEIPRAPERTRADWETSQAEIRVAYAPAGRETLDAITSEMFSQSDAGPEIQVREEPAGRETLAAIAEELRPGYRDQLDTLPYADRISNAPGAKTPSRTPRANPAHEAAPEITVREAPAGQETLAAIEAELATPESAEQLGQIQALEIFEMVTFVVRGSEAARLSTEALRKRFAEEQLMKRLPVSSAADIDRVDVTPWTVRDTFVVRVWCKVQR
jgi:hypothetical protein